MRKVGFFIKKVIRSIQVFFPFLPDLKYFFQRNIRNLFKLTFEKDFKLLKYFPDGQLTVVDVGGNRGQSIDAIGINKPGTIIHSFEASPDMFRKLESYYHNNKNIHLHNVGLGEMEGDKAFYVPAYRGYAFDGHGSLDRKYTEEIISNPNNYPGIGILFFNQGYFSIKQTTVKIKTLDGYNIEPFFIKIDVEGTEYNVLLGALKTIVEYSPILLIENAHIDTRIFELLKPYSYERYSFEDNRLIKDKYGQSNSFFITYEKLKLLNFPDE